MNSIGILDAPNTALRGCQSCRKKATMKMTCKCELVVCFNCRYPDKHNCTFDYKEEARKQLEKNNPIVVSEKLEKV